jgi:WD40 repeat protein
MTFPIELVDSLPEPVRGMIARAAAELGSAVLEVAIKEGATGILAHLQGSEREQVTRTFKIAIAATLQEFPELQAIDFEQWLARPPARDIFLRILSEPVLNPDPDTLQRLLAPTYFDPKTFPVSLPALVDSLQANFLAALYRNPTTARFYDALIQQQHGAEHSAMLRLLSAGLASLKRLEAMATQAQSQSARRRKQFTAPYLPAAFVKRPSVYEKAKAALLGADGGNVALSTALQGAGGFGKTTLAAALCHDAAVREEFEDGILWVELGETPNLQVKLAELYALLADERPGFVSADDAAKAVAAELEDLRCLIVIDDVWRPEHLKPFLRGGPRCARLLTTRHLHVVNDAQLITVDEMTTPEAVQMLLPKLPGAADHLEALHRLARRLGEWPLLLDLTGSTLRDLVRRGEKLGSALEFVEGRLARRGPAAFDVRNTHDRTMAVALTMNLSLRQLVDDELPRLLELSIFPEEVWVPLPTIALLWGCTLADARELLYRLQDLALLHYDPGAAAVRLHDVMRAFFADQLAKLTDVPAVHAHLVDNWCHQILQVDSTASSEDPSDGAAPARWWRLPPDEQYAWMHLAQHLVAAGRAKELERLLLDSRWLDAKLRVTGVSALLSDFTFSSRDPDLTEVSEAVRVSAHVLASDPNQFPAQLLGHLLGADRSEVREMLEDTRPLPPRAWLRPMTASLKTDALRRLLAGHTGRVTAVGLTPDGRWAISSATDGTVKVWDTERGEAIRTLQHDKVMAVAVSADGRQAVSAASDPMVKVWDVERGETLLTLDRSVGWYIQAMAVSADGRCAVSGAGEGSVMLWDLERREAFLAPESHIELVWAAGASADGRRAVTGGSDGTVKVWDLERRKAIRTMKGHVNSVAAVGVSADGRWAASGERGGTVKMWDLESGETVHTLQDDRWDWLTAIAVTMDGRRMLSSYSSSASVKVWDVEHGTVLRVLKGHMGSVDALAVTADGRWAVSGGTDTMVRVWDFEHGETLRKRDGHSAWVEDVAITADGRHALSGSNDNTMKLWDVKRGEVLRTFECRNGAMAVGMSADGRRAVLGGGGVRELLDVWDMDHGEVLHSLEGNAEPVRTVAVTADGSRAVSGSYDGTLALWDIERGELLHTQGLSAQEVLSVAITADGHRVISGTQDGSVKVWEVGQSEMPRTLGRHESSVLAVAMTADGRRAVSGAKDGSMKFWDLECADTIHTLEAHTDWVNAVALTENGRRAISGGVDGMVKVWDVDCGEHITSLTVDAWVRSIAVARDGATILVGDSRGRVHFLRLEEPSTVAAESGNLQAESC